MPNKKYVETEVHVTLLQCIHVEDTQANPCGGTFVHEPDIKVNYSSKLVRPFYPHRCDKCEQIDYLDQPYPVPQYRKLSS